jgi:hypothetical protein
MERFNRVSEVGLFLPELKSDNDFMLFSRLDDMKYIVNIVAQETLKDYWEVINRSKWVFVNRSGR